MRRGGLRFSRAAILVVAGGGIALAGLVALGFGAAAKADATPSILLQTAPDPAVVYPRQCAACHGSGGEGGTGPDLRTWSGNLEETGRVIAEGVGAMPAFAHTLAPEQIAVVAGFLDDLVGASTYGEFCSTCHGEYGEGGVGPSLTLSASTDEERRAAISEGIGSMGGFSELLSPDQIEALVRRTAGYAATGATIFEQQCAPCHGTAGEGASGPPLAGVELLTDELSAIITGGFGGMPAFASTFEPGDLEAVVAFIEGLEEPPEPSTTTTSTTMVPTTTTTQPTTTTGAADPAAGVDVYLAHCAACHGEDAEGGLGPSLVGGYSADVLGAVTRNGKGSMPGFEALLSDAEMDQLIGFLLSLGSEGDVPALPVLGAEVYAQQCAACHGVDGTGGIAKSLRTSVLSGQELRRAVEEGNETMPAFSRTLTTEELDAVLQHVEAIRSGESLAPELLDGPTIYRQDCAACHGDRGEGGIGPNLQGTELSVNEIIARVYGGHAEGMPAFEGALDSAQVLEVAQFIRSFEITEEEGGGLGAFAIAGIVVGALVALAGGSVAIRRWRRA
jgi:mono/diheme cytochrome c family protein